jgi:formylglycine-generating enzyme required for sulfatase activity
VFRDCSDCPQTGGRPARALSPKWVTTAAKKIATKGRDARRAPIVRAFAAGRFEVTQKQYATFVTATGHVVGGKGCNVWRSATRALERDVTLD